MFKGIAIVSAFTIVAAGLHSFTKNIAEEKINEAVSKREQSMQQIDDRSNYPVGRIQSNDAPVVLEQYQPKK